MAAPTVLFQLDADDYTVRVGRYAPRQQMARHAHDEDGISVILDGDLAEEAQHRPVVASAGWAVSKPRGVYHENRFGDRGATLLSITPRRSLAEASPTRWQWVNRAPAFRAALQFVRLGASPAPTDAGEAMADLVATLLPQETPRAPAPWLRRVREALDDPAAPSVATLALQAGVHPVYLARAFRAAFGVSLREYRRLVQLRRAMRLVVGTTLPLAHIALDCGFSDHSHMCRCFRLVAGWNPAVLRR